MITYIQGKKYNFEIVSQNKGQDFCFFIKAIDKHTRRFSCINNLNAILSEFHVGTDDPKVADSMWVVAKEDAHYLEKTAKQFLLDRLFLNYLEKQLDEDRTLGEWENKIDL